MTTVYATTPGARFHRARGCPAFASAQLLNDWDCGCDDYCRHRSPHLWSLREWTLEAATGDGKRPCTPCYPTPAEARAVLLPSGETFGHEPVDEYTGTAPGARGVTHLVCTRCMTWTAWTDTGLAAGARTPWPCTSAIVLGLIPRPEAT